MMWNYGMGWLGWTVMVAWWVFVVVGIVWLVRAVGAQSGETGPARHLLDERFAAGELSIDEYQTRRRALG